MRAVHNFVQYHKHMKAHDLLRVASFSTQKVV